MPFDLSNVFFIATANNYETIPQPLLDRMDIIDLVSYTSEEKFNIAKKHLIPKQLKKHGINPKKFKITDESIYEIIYCYTRESGVRTLERTLASLMRKAAKILVSNSDRFLKVDKCDLEELLGPKKFMKDKISKTIYPPLHLPEIHQSFFPVICIDSDLVSYRNIQYSDTGLPKPDIHPDLSHLPSHQYSSFHCSFQILQLHRHYPQLL